MFENCDCWAFAKGAAPYIIVVNVLGWLSGKLSRPNTREFYNRMKSPSFAPPGWVFAVVWPCLFIMLGSAAYLIQEKTANLPFDDRVHVFWPYFVNLFFNYTWSPIFFGLQNFKLALFWHIFIESTAILTHFRFASVSNVAGNLILPYIAWLTFAALLQIWYVFNGEVVKDEKKE